MHTFIVLYSVSLCKVGLQGGINSLFFLLLPVQLEYHYFVSFLKRLYPDLILFTFKNHDIYASTVVFGLQFLGVFNDLHIHLNS